MSEGVEMEKKKETYQCQAVATCAYLYDPKRGDKKGKIPAGIAFEELPEDWCCPGCGAKKDKFKCLGE
jgi:rubredoxin